MPDIDYFSRFILSVGKGIGPFCNSVNRFNFALLPRLHTNRFPWKYAGRREERERAAGANLREIRAVQIGGGQLSSFTLFPSSWFAFLECIDK